MLDRFRGFIAAEKLVAPKDRVLLAVSGGVDSVVMTTLFSLAAIPFGIAHCNFQLRGEESDGDEQFVKELAERLKAPFFSQRFNTEEAAVANVSIQMAARELRYEWLETVRAEHGFATIATAHHLDDSIETAVHNFIRGTGVSGLRGILQKSGKLIRPLLFAHRADVESFAKAHAVPFREDASNRDTKYTRNKIRHTILPMLREINPGFDGSMIESMRHHRDTEIALRQVIQRLSKRLLSKRHNDWFIPILSLKKLQYKRTALFEVIRDFGFNIDQVDHMLGHLDGQPGKVFESPDHRLVKDRRFLIITRKEAGRATWLQVSAADEMVHGEDIVLRCSRESAVAYVAEPSSKVATLDYEALEFPLTLRKWRQGDYFFPFGMKGKKKVSKFFKDEKIPLPEKERIWILLSGDRVVWIVNHRIDNRFRVTDKTRSVYRVEVIT